MQLGELQSQLDRFEARGVDVIAISVDPLSHSRRLIRRLGIDFKIASDADQTLIKAFGVQNQHTLELALHAVFVIDEHQEIIYRKVAGRRPLSAELIDAIDYARGAYPGNDEALARGDIQMAYPSNNFQALIEIATRSAVSPALKKKFGPTLQLITNGEGDDAVFEYRRVQSTLPEEDLLPVATWLASEAVALSPDAQQAAHKLNATLIALRSAQEHNDKAKLRAELDALRTKISRNTDKWSLRKLRSIIRTYSELARANQH